MKKYFSFVLLTALQFSGMAQVKSEKEPFMTKSLSSESIKDVQVQTSGGSISVSGVAPSEARVEVYVSPNNEKNDLSKAEIQQRLNQLYDLNISVASNKLTTTGGSLDLKDLKGDIRASTSGGSVVGRNVEGELIAHTSGGSIHLSDLSCSLETSTSGGNIDVSIKQLGKYVKISNSAGNIDLE